MEVGLTFGSLGDIIAICQLAVQLSRALGLGARAVGGSAKEYQELRKDLDLFVQILLQVVATYQQRESPVVLSGLDRATQAVIDECAGLINQALQHFGARYHNSLSVEGSGNKWRDAYKKIEWRIREKERLLDLQQKLQKNTERLSLVNGLAVRRTSRVDSATMLARIDEVHRLTSACQEEILRMLQKHHSTVEQQGELLETISNELTTQSRNTSELLNSTKNSVAAIVEIKDKVDELTAVTVRSRLTDSASSSLRFIDPTKELPVMLEDALGRQLSIPPEWIDFLRWSTLNSLLEDRFVGQKGHSMVRQNLYALEERCSKKELDRRQPLSLFLRRGMRIDMSMLFMGWQQSGICPRCRTQIEIPKDVTIQCKAEGCGFWFRLASAREATAEFSLNSAFTHQLEDEVSESHSGDAESTRLPNNLNTKPSHAAPSDFVRAWLVPYSGRPDSRHVWEETGKESTQSLDHPLHTTVEMITSNLESLTYPAVVDLDYPKMLISENIVAQLGIATKPLPMGTAETVSTPFGHVTIRNFAFVLMRLDLGTLWPFYLVPTPIFDPDEGGVGQSIPPIVIGEDFLNALKFPVPALPSEFDVFEVVRLLR